MNKRDDCIYTARGITIFLIIVTHMLPTEYGIGQLINSFIFPIFFVTVGLAAQESKYKYLYYYLIFSLISIIYDLMVYGYETLPGLIKATVSLKGIDSLGLLMALFGAKLAFDVFNRIESKNLRIAIFVGLVLCTGIFNAINYREMDGNIVFSILDLCNVINRALLGSVFIIISSYMYKIYDGIKNKSIIWIIAVLCLCCNLILFRFNVVDLRYSELGNPALFYINAISGSIALIFISKLVSKSRLLKYWGINSIIIYSTYYNLDIVANTMKLFGSGRVILTIVMVAIIETLIVINLNIFKRGLSCEIKKIF